jgi:hypothetical protein
MQLAHIVAGARRFDESAKDMIGYLYYALCVYFLHSLCECDIIKREHDRNLLQTIKLLSYN